jgi:DNA-directed RNA polymerase specialized sigma24 family protein
VAFEVLEENLFTTSEELFKACLVNDPRAWTFAYSYVIAYVRKKFPFHPETLELAHDTILYFMDGGIEAIDRPRAFKMWLRLKAEGLYIDRRRFEASHPHEPIEIGNDGGNTSRPNPAIEPDRSTPDNAIFLEKALKVVRMALNSLSQECRELLEKYFRSRYLGHKTKDLALEMGSGENALRTKIHRCHKKLMQHPAYREILEEYN